MCDLQNTENSLPDSQDTYYDKNEGESQNLFDNHTLSGTQNLNESQDFHLIDSGDSGDVSLSAREDTGVSQMNVDVKEKTVHENKVQAADPQNLSHSENAEESAKSEDVEEEKQESGRVLEVSEEDVKRNLDDEDEIIQGTPPEIHSPVRRSLVTGMTPGKRRAEAIDEPACKIPRILSQEDSLTLSRKNLETQFDNTTNSNEELELSDAHAKPEEAEGNILCEDTEKVGTAETQIVLQSEPKGAVVIEETQEISDSELIVQEHVQSSMDVLEKDDRDLNDQFDESSQQIDFSSGNYSLEKDKSDTKCNSSGKDDDLADSTNKNQPEVSLLEKETEEKRIVVEKINQNLSDGTCLDEEIKEDHLQDQPILNECESNGSKDINLKNSKETHASINNTPIETMHAMKADSDRKELHDGQENNDEKEISHKNEQSSQPISDTNSNSNSGSNNTNRSRMSIEVIYDRKSVNAEKAKPTELVEIDEDGEKIVLDSSQENLNLCVSQSPSMESLKNETIYKSCIENKSSSDASYKSFAQKDPTGVSDLSVNSDCELTNGDDYTAKKDYSSDKTASMDSDFVKDLSQHVTERTASVVSNMFIDDSTLECEKLIGNDTSTCAPGAEPRTGEVSAEVINVSDSEGDNSMANENFRNKSSNDSLTAQNNSVTANTILVEKKTRFLVELKYVLHMDPNTKQIVRKELLEVVSEPRLESSIQRRNSDISACLADVSGNENKDTSPGSVTSIAQPYSLPPHNRFSMLSTVSSSSSASSAASLAVKLAEKDKANFSLPRGPAKHARKPILDSTSEDMQSRNETIENLVKEWKNANIIFTILNSVNSVLLLPDFANGHGLEDDNIGETILSSTPEQASEEKKISAQTTTPKSTKRGRPPKKLRGRNAGVSRSNGTTAVSPEMVSTSQEHSSGVPKKSESRVGSVAAEVTSVPITNASTPVRTSLRSESLRSLTPQNVPNDQLIGRNVFAKWSDHKYYPGMVSESVKGKFRVQFLDGKNKLLIEEFIIPMPKIMNEGLSVYAFTNEDPYGSCGIIVNADTSRNEVWYTVETDEGERIKVQTKDIFLTSDQAQVLREDETMESKSLPQTPQHLGQVSLDNLVDGKRRSKRATTPNVLTPKSRKDGTTPRKSKLVEQAVPSVSGVPKLPVKEVTYYETDDKTSDSNTSILEEVGGVQPELPVTPSELVNKGPPSRMKGRGRSRAKQSEDQETINLLGPIPPASSNIFKNMSFILTCASNEGIARYRSGEDDSYSDAGTENEEEWARTPFVRDRIKKQLINGGGRVYNCFEVIPPDEYKCTKLITNIPNTTAKSLQCLSVGITTYHHKWVILSCIRNELVNPTCHELPAGWSYEKRGYVDMFQRPKKQPLEGVLVVLPTMFGHNPDKRFIRFWRRICENAGGVVLLIDDPATDFSHGTVVLTDSRCPSWIVDKAQNWQIPLVSTNWIVACLIEGKVCPYDSQPAYKHNYIQP